MKKNLLITLSILMNLSAIAQPATFNVNALSNPANAGYVTGIGLYQSGDTVTLTAVSNIGYKFRNWTHVGIILDTNSTISFPITADMTLNANFIETAQEFTISTSVFPENAGTTAGQGIYEEGDTVNLLALHNTGFTFNNWTINGIIASYDSEYSFIAEADVHIFANFSFSTPVDEADNSITINVFPNPSPGRVNLLIDNECQLKVFNTTGNYIQSYNLMAGLNEIELLHPGVYMLQFIDSKGKISIKRLVITI